MSSSKIRSTLIQIVFAIIMGACAPQASLPATTTPIPTEALQTEALPETQAEPGAPVYLVDLWNLAGYGAGGNFSLRHLLDGTTIQAHGKTYQQGIWAHADSLGEWRLYGQYERLETDILLMDWEVCGDGAIFRIVVDDVVRYESPLFTQATKPLRIDVDLTGGDVLRLEAGIGAAGNNECDWAVWGDPVLYPRVVEASQPTSQTEFFVSPDGSDQNDGSLEHPFATLERARTQVRTINDNMSAPVTVLLRGGTYLLSQTFYLGAQDSGSNGFEVSYEAYPGETPVLSGGMLVTGWQPLAGSEIWSTAVQLANPRQLYINGQRAQRAQTSRTMRGLGWAEGDFSTRDGIFINANALPSIDGGHSMELHWIYEWKDIRVPVESIETLADGRRVIWLEQPQFSWATNMEMFHEIFPRPDVPFYVEGALELLDEPGEWFYDEAEGELYYWPLADEDMVLSEAIVPLQEFLLSIQGQGVDQPVTDIAVRGITFSHNAWPRASIRGTFGGQSQSLIDNANPFLDYVLTPAAIEIQAARNILFENNIVEHIGSAGVWLVNDVADARLVGNIFRDISDAAIVVGMPGHAYMDVPGEAATRNNLIANNLIRQVGVEYWGAPGISAFYTQGLQIVHNDMASMPYSGIALGWGWSSELGSKTAHDNLVANNLISDLSERARDAGGVYTLGQQPGTIVRENVIRRLNADYACLYPDEGSAAMLFDSNVCDTAPAWAHLWIHTVRDIEIHNTFTNVARFTNSGTNVRITGTTRVSGQNWPAEAQAIIDRAGLEPAYQFLLEK